VRTVNSAAQAEDARAMPAFRSRRQTSPTAFTSQLRTASQRLPAQRPATGPSTGSARRPVQPPTPSTQHPTSGVGVEEAGKYAALINGAAARHGVDPTLVAAVARAESNFNPKAVSHAGAKGLMQLMDGTARMLGVENSFDPAQNVEGGTKFLGEMLKKFKKPELALAAYNAGPGNVAKYGGVPPFKETQTYVKRVLGYQAEMKDEA
jgi:soluble lytic murein transglycosylase-like protein